MVARTEGKRSSHLRQHQKEHHTPLTFERQAKEEGAIGKYRGRGVMSGKRETSKNHSAQ